MKTLLRENIYFIIGTVIITPIYYYIRKGEPFVLDLLFVKIMSVIFLIFNLPNIIIYWGYYNENKDTKIKLDIESNYIGITKNGVHKQYKISEIKSSIYHLGVYYKNRIDNARRWKMINSDLAYWDLEFNNGDRYYISNLIVDFLHERPIVKNTKYRFRMFQYINKSDSKEAIELKQQQAKTRADRLRELYSKKSTSELEYIVENKKLYMANARKVANQIIMERKPELKMWTPITEKELYSEIWKSESELDGKYLNFWNLINISPEKWSEPNFGNEGGGFWVVAICGRKIIWYNDIEEGFNISDYTEYGKINGYYCNQDELNIAVLRLFELITFGGQIVGQAGPPINMR